MIVNVWLRGFTQESGCTRLRSSCRNSARVISSTDGLIADQSFNSITICIVIAFHQVVNPACPTILVTSCQYDFDVIIRRHLLCRHRPNCRHLCDATIVYVLTDRWTINVTPTRTCTCVLISGANHVQDHAWSQFPACRLSVVGRGKENGMLMTRQTSLDTNGGNDCTIVPRVRMVITDCSRRSMKHM